MLMEGKNNNNNNNNNFVSRLFASFLACLLASTLYLCGLGLCNCLLS